MTTTTPTIAAMREALAWYGDVYLMTWGANVPTMTIVEVMGTRDHPKQVSDEAADIIREAWAYDDSDSGFFPAEDKDGAK